MLNPIGSLTNIHGISTKSFDDFYNYRLPEIEPDIVDFNDNKVRLVYGTDGMDLADLMTLYVNNMHERHPVFDNILNPCFRFLMKKVPQKNSYVFMVKKGEKLIGGVAAEINRKKNSINCSFLVIDKKYQKTKTGAKGIINILNELYNLADREGIGEISWFAAVDNKKAINFYNKFAKPTISKDGKVLEYTISLNVLKNKVDKLNKLETKLKEQ